MPPTTGETDRFGSVSILKVLRVQQHSWLFHIPTQISTSLEPVLCGRMSIRVWFWQLWSSRMLVMTDTLHQALLDSKGLFGKWLVGCYCLISRSSGHPQLLGSRALEQGNRKGHMDSDRNSTWRQNTLEIGEIYGSVFKNTSCYCRGSGFYFKHLQGGPQPSVTSVSRDPIKLLASVDTKPSFGEHTHIRGKQSHIK